MSDVACINSCCFLCLWLCIVSSVRFKYCFQLYLALGLIYTGLFCTVQCCCILRSLPVCLRREEACIMYHHCSMYAFTIHFLCSVQCRQFSQPSLVWHKAQRSVHVVRDMPLVVGKRCSCPTLNHSFQHGYFVPDEGPASLWRPQGQQQGTY